MTSKGPGLNWTEETRHFEGPMSQSDRENTSRRGVRVTIGPRKHVTSKGPGLNWTEETCHFEGSGAHSDRENTSLRGDRVAIGPRKHLTSRIAGRHRTDKTRHIEGPGSHSGRENTALRGGPWGLQRGDHRICPKGPHAHCRIALFQHEIHRVQLRVPPG